MRLLVLLALLLLAGAATGASSQAPAVALAPSLALPDVPPAKLAVEPLPLAPWIGELPLPPVGKLRADAPASLPAS